MIAADRTLIAIAALLIASTQVPGPGSELNFDRNSNAIVSPTRTDILWPYTQDICPIPVCMEVGYYVEIKWSDANDPAPNYTEPRIEARDLERREIVLRQVDCGAIGKDSEKDWPCYLGCEKLSIRSNLDIKLDTRLDKTSDVIDQWEAYLGTNIVTASGQWQTVKVCVKAWNARLHDVMGPQQLQVGTLTITVKPAV
jgi:hypothetical protein